MVGEPVCHRFFGENQHIEARKTPFFQWQSPAEFITLSRSVQSDVENPEQTTLSSYHLEVVQTSTEFLANLVEHCWLSQSVRFTSVGEMQGQKKQGILW